MDEGQKLDTWGVVEVMGHKKYAGKLSEFVVGGTSFVRVDVPAVEGAHAQFCKLIGPGSVYCITPTDEATARKVVFALSGYAEILPVYIPAEPKRIPAAVAAHDVNVEISDDPDGDGLFDEGEDGGWGLEP
jgi:hypothetical protein